MFTTEDGHSIKYADIICVSPIEVGADGQYYFIYIHSGQRFTVTEALTSRASFITAWNV